MSDKIPLESKIKLEVVGSNYIIENLDVDCKIKMTDQDQPNECTLTIWNLSDTSFSNISDKTKGVKVYFAKWDEEYKLIFEGNLKELEKRRKKTTKRKSKRKIKYNTPAITQDISGADIGTVITLQESYKDYMEIHFSKSYKGEISTETILNDMISASGYPSLFIGNLSHRVYKNSKVVHGPLRRELFNLLNSIGASYSFQNGVIQVLAKGATKLNPVISFTSNDVDSPEELDDLEIRFTTQITPQLRPNDWIELKTRRFNDLYRISKLEHQFDNYGKNLESKITVTSQQVAVTEATKYTDATNTGTLDSANLNTTAIGKRVADKSESMYGKYTSTPFDSPSCRRGVQNTLDSLGIVVDRTLSAKDFGRDARRSSSFNKAYIEVSSSELPKFTAALYRLPRGTIAVYQPYPGGSKHGHVEIKTGSTAWVSDHKILNRQSYGGTFPSSVFLPRE